MLNSQQTGQDGIGQEKTIYSSGVRLVAKPVTTTRTTTLKITGMTTGATWTIDVVVKPGGQVYFTSPIVSGFSRSVSDPREREQERREERRRSSSR
jgi:hypothetical protein